MGWGLFIFWTNEFRPRPNDPNYMKVSAFDSFDLVVYFSYPSHGCATYRKFSRGARSEVTPKSLLSKSGLKHGFWSLELDPR